MKTKKAILGLSRDKWRELIAEQEASRSSVSAYCRERGINEKTFYNWRRKFGDPQESNPKRFIQIKAMENESRKVLRIQTPGGYRLELEPRTERGYVQSILEMLAALE